VKTTTRNIIMGKTKFKIVSHYTGDKDINRVIEELAVRKAIYEYNNRTPLPAASCGRLSER